MSEYYRNRRCPGVRYRSLAFLGHPKYAVGTDGSVWSCCHGRWKRRKPNRTRQGHLQVGLSENGHGKNLYIHRLVLLSFVGPCPAGMEACHCDDVPTNNHLENLRWDTHKENAQDAIRNGKFNGKSVGRPPLPKEQRRVGFSLRIRERLLNRLRDHAYREKTAHNVVIETALEEYLDEHDGRPKPGR